MSEVGAEAAHRHREHMQSKARRLGGGSDATNVDASSFTPGEPLNADAKTGMRPVSRQARKDGGAVTGKCAGGRADRPARKAGGGLGISYANRNQKAANADREGRIHDMGLASGGMTPSARRKASATKAVARAGLSGFPSAAHKEGYFSMGESNPHPPGSTQHTAWQAGADEAAGEERKKGGRAHRAGGGNIGLDLLEGPVLAALTQGGGGDKDDQPSLTPAAPRANGGGINRDSGVFKPDIEQPGATATRRFKEASGSSAVETRLGRASGGRVARQTGGPLAPPISNQGRLGSFNYAPNRATLLADGGRAKAHERYGPGPGPAEHHPGMGDRPGRASGGACAGPAENQSASGQPSLRHRAPHGEASIRARTLASAEGRASGGEVAEKVLAAHHAEHKAMAKGRAKGGRSGHPEGCTCPRCAASKAKGGLLSKWTADQKAAGGAVARARGGRSGKGKMNVNIVIAPGGMNPQAAGPPGGLPPNLAIKPPPAAAPVPMPTPGAPPAAAPGVMPMPMPIPVGGGMPGAGAGAMPPRARGGRAPRVRGEPEAGSGSGLGRLQKAEEYGHRSREGERRR